ncbi:hypothetical protein [Tolypothrix sp. NIES-4075]|uniref:hypothetical protein n=1 Tax=Tolypothrix sp. NIES-4075 TaxID=2005459 RepID=UPI0011811FF4|nr:hypothetical protein [Tolypothrix sp. NIES-4075]
MSVSGIIPPKHAFAVKIIVVHRQRDAQLISKRSHKERSPLFRLGNWQYRLACTSASRTINTHSLHHKMSENSRCQIEGWSNLPLPRSSQSFSKFVILVTSFC